ncbi:MAG: Crp/Fnr family transcriptional regulator [Parvularculaceae bacterium]
MPATSLESKAIAEEDAKTETKTSGLGLAEAVAAAKPFEGLPQAVLDAICEIAEKRAYAAGEPVFAFGQYDASDFFLVLSGRLQAAVADPKSDAMLFYEIEEGALFGLEMAINEKQAGEIRQITLTAENGAELAVFDSDAFRAIVSQRPSLTRNLMSYFASQLSKLQFRSVEEGFTPEQRVIAALMEYVERDSVAGVWRIVRMPKHRELADKAKVDDATAAGVVAQLIQEGTAQREYPGLIINDMDRLNALAG